MKCYANRVNTRLLNTPGLTPVTATLNGIGVRVFPDQSDRQGDSIQEFRFMTSLVFSGGASSPTAQLILQGSIDGMSWIDLVLGTVRNEAGTYYEGLDSNNVGILPWVRARLVIGGGTPPGVVAGVDIISTAPFTLSLV